MLNVWSRGIALWKQARARQSNAVVRLYEVVFEFLFTSFFFHLKDHI